MQNSFKIPLLISFTFFVLLICINSKHQNLAYAVTMTTVLNPNNDTTTVHFNEVHAAIFDYPQASKLANLFKEIPARVTANASSASNSSQNGVTSNHTPSNSISNSNTNQMNSLLNSINRQFANMKSVVRATAIKINFIADIKQNSASETSVAQRINIDLTISGFVIQNNNDPNHKYVDLNWRDFKITDPITLEYSGGQSKNSSRIDINHILPMLYTLNPGFKDEMNYSSPTNNNLSHKIEVLDSPLLDFSRLSLPLDKWYVLFDPAASLVETQGYGFKGEANGARAITIYSLGEGSIREGKHNDVIYNIIFGKDDQYKSELTIPAPNARIDILGYSKMITNGGDDTAIVSQRSEGGSSYAGNFPFVVLGGFGAIMALIVGIVLIKSRKDNYQPEGQY